MGVSFLFCVSLSSFHSYAVMLCRCVPAVFPPLLCQPDSLCYNGGKGTSGAGYGLRGTAGGIEDVENAEIGV